VIRLLFSALGKVHSEAGFGEIVAYFRNLSNVHITGKIDGNITNNFAFSVRVGGTQTRPKQLVDFVKRLTGL
jgi:hypothetical protein